MNTEDALLIAARKGETTAMRALADFYRERDNKPLDPDDPHYTDRQIATSFYMTSFHCELASVQLNQIEAMLDWNQPPEPQILLPENRRVTRAKARQISEFLHQHGFPVMVKTDRLDPGYITAALSRILYEVIDIRSA